MGGVGSQGERSRPPLWAVLAPLVSGAGSKRGRVPATVFCILCVLAAPVPSLKWSLHRLRYAVHEFQFR